jgi:MoxR-like ATPase
LSDITTTPEPIPASTPVVDLAVVPAKLTRIENVLNGKILERKREIETAVTALIANKHHCQIGPPGIGKTFLVDELHKLITDARYFRWLMTRFTTPEEVFGPVSLKELENDHYVRHTAGKLPESDVAFLDEIFKANSSILNSFLTIMNEGLFFNNGAPMQCHPIIFAGSNEHPKDAELAAMWDRVTFRHLVKGLASNGSRKKMLKARATRAAQTVTIEPVITWAEIGAAQQAATKVDIPDVVLDSLIELWGKLRAEGIEPTDRRYNDCIPIIQATAFRAGRSVADVEDMRLLRYVLWTEFSQQKTVEKFILELANPLDVKASVLIEQIDALTTEVDEIVTNTDNVQTRRRRAVEINGKLTRLGKDLDDLQAEISQSAKRSELIGDAQTQLGNLVQRLLKELFDMKSE